MDAMRAILLQLVFAFLFFTSLYSEVILAASDVDVLEIKAERGGGVYATARIVVPAKPSVVQSLLTDYQRWPELFEVRMKLVDLKVHDGVATTDLRIEHALILGERRLITESRPLPNGGLVTDLKGGDFKQYHRVWKLLPAGEGSQTRAEFELLVELESLVPDWLVAIAMRHELETHFRIIKQKALEHPNR